MLKSGRGFVWSSPTMNVVSYKQSHINVQSYQYILQSASGKSKGALTMYTPACPSGSTNCIVT